MSNELPTIKLSEEIISKLALGGDMSGLSPVQKVEYYKAFCERIGLDPITQPFKILRLQGKETLYCDRGGAAQLNRKHKVSHEIKAREETRGCFVVTAKASTAERSEESIGAVPIENLKGEALCNAMMKAETKAKRRSTLDLCGLGILDESEIGAWANGARTATISVEDGELVYDESAVEIPMDNDAINAHEAQRERDARANSGEQKPREYQLRKPPGSSDSNAPAKWQDVTIHFGKNKGIRLGDLDTQGLRWYQHSWQPRPFRGRISDQDRALRDALDESQGKGRQTLAIGTPSVANSIERSDLYAQFADYIKSKCPADISEKVFAGNFCRELGKLLGKGDALASLDALTDEEIAQAWELREKAAAMFAEEEPVPF